MERTELVSEIKNILNKHGVLSLKMQEAAIEIADQLCNYVDQKIKNENVKSK